MSTEPHPVDVWLARLHYENRMEHIRELDIDEWVREVRDE